MIGPTPACFRCKRFSGEERFDTENRRTFYFCEAFPDGEGIPEIVWCAGDRHTRPIEGDGGLRFIPKDDK
ncbi:MAG: hypothetical protein CSA35_08010 [Dethiosulfovibrio peptidovorans]|nr:MAG: hypothetical protein CSA35_08010 [Dethiosulfovibrio peptidovorans]